MNSLTNPNTVWHISKIVGLKIRDSENWRNFIFGDATIVNNKQLKKYISDNEFWFATICNQSLERYHDDDTLIIVEVKNKHKVNKSSDEPKNKLIEKQEKQKIVEQANNRVKEVVGFVYFVYLFLTDFRYGIALSEQVYPMTGSNYIVIGGEESYDEYDKYTNGECLIKSPDIPFIINIEELVNIFKRPYFINIFNLVKSRKDENFILAIRNFFITSNANSPATQLLGSITSLELLLKINSKDSYDNLRKRVYVIGEMQQNSKIVSNIENLSYTIDVRHDVIHNGKLCTNGEVRGSIKLFSCALIMYAHLHKLFKHRNVICRHLDLVYSIFKDDGLKMDTFNVKNEWKNYYFEYDSIDWHIRKITSYYGLCNPETEDIDLIKYVEAIALYSNLSNKEMELSFNNFNDFNYYNRFPFDRYDSYIALYNENEQQINEKIESFKRWHGLA